MTTLWCLAVLQVIWIDVLLSGDNAVVIALACQSLPQRQRRVGIVLGVGVAITARLALAVLVTTVLAVPMLKLVAGSVLLYIAVKVTLGSDDIGQMSPSATGLWHAIGLIALADLTMSLDNVVAISAAAQGHISVFVIGLLISMPCTVVGASVISRVITRVPLLVWAGGALLGWIAGGMIISDPLLTAVFPTIGYMSNTAGAIAVTGMGWLLCHRAAIKRRIAVAKATA